MIVGDGCNNSAMSDTVKPSFRFFWVNPIQGGLFAVLYSAASSSETTSADGISTLNGSLLWRDLFLVG